MLRVAEHALHEQARVVGATAEAAAVLEGAGAQQPVTAGAQTAACDAQALGPGGARGAVQHAAEAVVEGVALGQAVEVTQVGCPVEGHPLVGLLGAQDRVAIVESALQVSEGYRPWGAVRQLAHPVLMAVAPARLLSRESDTAAAAHRDAPAAGAGTPAPRPPGRPLPRTLSSNPQITAQEGPQREQKVPEEALSSRTRVDGHLSPGWLCDPRGQLNLSVPSCPFLGGQEPTIPVPRASVSPSVQCP